MTFSKVVNVGRLSPEQLQANQKTTAAKAVSSAGKPRTPASSKGQASAEPMDTETADELKQEATKSSGQVVKVPQSSRSSSVVRSKDGQLAGQQDQMANLQAQCH